MTHFTEYQRQTILAALLHYAASQHSFAAIDAPEVTARIRDQFEAEALNAESLAEIIEQSDDLGYVPLAN